MHDGLTGGTRLDDPGRGDRFARLVIGPLLALFFLIILFFYVLFDVTSVEGDSMLPNFLPKDRVLLTKSYDDPRRGDVVIVHTRERNGELVDIIKRVVAVPGDVVEIVGDRAIVNGVAEGGYPVIVDEEASVDRGPITVGEGEVYLLGDNRPVSFDSRFFGPLPYSAVDGRAVFVWAPINRIRLVPRQDELTPAGAAR